MAINVEDAARGLQCFWGAPTVDQSRICWEETRKACGSSVVFKESERVAIFPSGGRIIYRSLDNPDNARGFTLDRATIDEAAYVKEAAWYEVIRPALLDTRGSAWIIFTPQGQNWVWRESMQANDSEDSRFWNAPTLGVEITRQGLVRAPHPLENPHIDIGEIEQLFRTLPERVFRQEVLAEFIEDAGGVFRGVSAAVDAGRSEPEPVNETYAYTMGIDLARVADFSVLSVLDDLGRQVYFERFNEISWARQVAAVARVARIYHPAIIVDKTGLGDPVVEQIRGAVYEVDPSGQTTVDALALTNANKEQMIDKLAIGIESGGVRLMDIPIQTTELQAYQYELTAARNVRMSAPEGMHDDTVIALALAYSRSPMRRREIVAIHDQEDQPAAPVANRGSKYY